MHLRKKFSPHTVFMSDISLMAGELPGEPSPGFRVFRCSTSTSLFFDFLLFFRYSLLLGGKKAQVLYIM